MKREYSVGDVVVIKKMVEGDDYPFGVTRQMTKFANSIAFITKKKRFGPNIGYYLDIDDGFFCWHRCMFYDQDVCPC